MKNFSKFEEDNKNAAIDVILESEEDNKQENMDTIKK